MTRRAPKWGDYNRRVEPYHHRWPIQPRRLDESILWCSCDEPKPRPVTLFGCAMGGMQECATCRMPILGSEATNPRGPVPTFIVALTTGQRLTFAIVAAVFVVVFVVWPTVRPRPRMRSTDVESSTAWRRLMRELRRQP